MTITEPTLFDALEAARQLEDTAKRCAEVMAQSGDTFNDLQRIARNTDPGTSHAARRSPHRVTQRERVLEALRSAPDGLTDYELSVITGILRGTAAKRRGELCNRNLVINSGRVRVTDTDSKAIVWVAK